MNLRKLYENYLLCLCTKVINIIITPKKYYVFFIKLEVPDNATEKEIDDIVFNQTFQENDEKPADYVWSEKPNLFWGD